MADRVILFDFDGTLMNTSRLIHECIHPALAQATGITASAIKQIQDEYLQTISSSVDFNPDTFIALVAQKTQSQVSELSQVFYQAEFYQSSVFPEVIDILAAVSQRYPIGVFTQGVPSWQKNKLDLAGLTQLFSAEYIFINARKTTKQVLSTLPRPCIVVDDNYDIITTLQYEPDIAPIYLDRASQSQNPNSIHTLQELLALI